jgi:cytochrome P450
VPQFLSYVLILHLTHPNIFHVTMIPFIWIFLVIAVFVAKKTVETLTIQVQRRRFAKQHGCEPPNEMTGLDALFGSDKVHESYQNLCKNSYLRMTTERFAKYGNTFTAKMMGARVINTIEPSNLQAILAHKFNEFSLGGRRRKAFFPLLGHSIFTTDGQAWQHSRQMLRPSFARDTLENLDLLECHTQNFLANIPRDGTTVDLQELFFRYTMDLGSELFFGASCHTLKDKNDGSSKRFSDAFNKAQRQIADDTALGILSKLTNRKVFKEDCKIVHDMIDGYVEKALAAKRNISNPYDEEKKAGSRYVVLDELTEQTDDPVQIRSELLSILVAARDTTASLLGNLWYTLARMPEVWETLQAEVEAIGGDKPSFTQLKDMSYLQACISEGM